MKRDELAVQGIVVLFFGFMLFSSFRLHGVKRFGDMGSEFWPVLILGSALILSLVLFVTSIKRYLREKAQGTPEGSLTEEEILLRRSGRRKFFLSVLCLFLYIVIMPWVGFIISTLLFTLAFILALEERRRFVLIIGPLAVTALIVYVFGRFIGMPLPRGTETFAALSRIFY